MFIAYSRNKKPPFHGRPEGKCVPLVVASEHVHKNSKEGGDTWGETRIQSSHEDSLVLTVIIVLRRNIITKSNSCCSDQIMICSAMSINLSPDTKHVHSNQQDAWIDLHLDCPNYR